MDHNKYPRLKKNPKLNMVMNKVKKINFTSAMNEKKWTKKCASKIFP
jgi:hypothetical protein